MILLASFLKLRNSSDRLQYRELCKLEERYTEKLPPAVTSVTDKRTLYIESPGAFLQFLIESDSRKLAREFENWLLERLQGSTRNKRCRRGSFYGKAYAQYTALVDYYEKLDLMAQVPDLDEVKRFLLTASRNKVQLPFESLNCRRLHTYDDLDVPRLKSVRWKSTGFLLLNTLITGLPRGHLVRIPHEEDPTHGGIYRVVERLDRCTFLLENADRLQVATDASLHVVRSKCSKLAFPLHPY